MTVQTEPTPTTSRRWWIVVGVALAAVVVAAGSYLALRTPDPLADDPNGAAACHDLTDWLNGKVTDPATGRPESYAIMSVAVSTPAAAAKNGRIRAVVGDDVMAGDVGDLLKSYGGPASFRVTKLENLYGACDAAGVKMPPYKVPA